MDILETPGESANEEQGFSLPTNENYELHSATTKVPTNDKKTNTPRVPSMILIPAASANNDIVQHKSDCPFRSPTRVSRVKRVK